MLKIPYLIPVDAQNEQKHSEHYFLISDVVNYLKQSRTNGAQVLCFSFKDTTHPAWYRLFLDKENNAIPEGVHLITRYELPYLVTPIPFKNYTIYLANTI